MKRILLKVAVSILTFVLGIGVSALWRLYSYANAPEHFIAGISEDIPSPVLSLNSVVIGCGSQLTVTSYILSNGAEIMRTCQHFSSDAEATNVMHARRGVGFELIESSVTNDSDGQRIGETAVFSSSYNVVRLTRDGATLCETRAPSLGNLHWFENRYFPGIPPSP
jgi:hypothetical protein